MATQLILTEDVYKLGEAGDVVRVKNGYARNYLIPQGKAMLATSGRVAEIDHKKRVVEEKVKRDVAELKTRAAEVAKAKLAFERQAGPEGKLFGSVTVADVHAQLAEQGFDVDRRKIVLAEAIKEIGEHEIKVRLHREVIVDLSLTVTGVGAPEPEPVDEDDARPEADSDEHSDEDED